MLSQCGGVARWPGWKPQNGDCTNVAAYEDCRIRGPGHRRFPDRAVQGTDVFAVVDLSGTNDPVSAGLMLKFINRVAKLR
jgi:hypothetical protein